MKSKMDIEGSSFLVDATSPEKSCLGQSRLSDLNLTLPFKSLASENDLGLLDRHIDSTFECDPEDFGNCPQPSQIIPSGIESLVNAREVAGNVSWTSSMATPLSKNVTYSNLNTEERRIFLPSDDCASEVKRRALFTPDLSETTLCNDATETPKGLRATKTNVGRTLLAHQEDYSFRSDSLLFTPKKSDADMLELSSKRKSSDALSPIVSKKRLKMQRNRKRNKVVGSPDPTNESILNRTTASVDLFNDSEEDIFSEFENACSTPSRSASETAESSTSSFDKNPKSTTTDNSKNESLDLEKTLTELVPKVGWSPDDSFSEDMVKAFTALEENPVISELKSRVQSIKEACSSPSLLYDKTAISVPKSSETAEDILKSMVLQGKYTDSQPVKMSCLPNHVQQELVPFSQLESVINVQVEQPLTTRGKDVLMEKSGSDKNLTLPEELSTLTDQQLILAGEEAEMLLLLEHEDDWLQSKLDQCTENSERVKGGEQQDDDFKTASGKNVFVSQMAIDRANKLLADVEEESTSGQEGDVISISSAAEKQSSDSPNARKLSDDDMNNGVLSQAFRTANGRSIAVSQEALEKAKKLIDKDDCQSKKRKFEEYEEVEFATASGKSIEVSQEALEKARQLLNEEDDGGVAKRMKAEDVVTLDNLCVELENMEDDGLDGQKGVADCRKVLPLEEDFAKDEGQNRSTVLDSFGKDTEVENDFVTASGKMVPISESSLNKVNRMFVDDNSTVEEIVADTQKLRSAVVSSRSRKLSPTSTEGGFATASGKKVLISSSALEKAKKILADEDSTVEEIVAGTQKLRSAVALSRRQLSPTSTDGGFATASGKKVSISSSALEKAKKILADEDSTVEEIVAGTQKLRSAVASSRRQLSPTSTDGGFATASGKKVSISSSALEKAKKILADEDSTVEEIVADTQKLRSAVVLSRYRKLNSTSTGVGFETTSGKNVKISVSALEKAVNLLARDGAVVKDSSALLEDQNRKNLANSSGFATASGKDVLVSMSACEEAAKLFDDVNADVEDLSALAESIRNRRVREGGAAVRLLEEENNFSVRDSTKFSSCATEMDYKCGFATASGDLVSVSYESLRKDKLLFKDYQNNTLGPTDGICLSPIVGGAKKREVLRRVENDGFKVPLAVQRKSPKMSKAFDGFSTASGRSVFVSQKALAKARAIFEEIDQEDNEGSIKVGRTESDSLSAKALNRDSGVEDKSTESYNNGTSLSPIERVVTRSQSIFQESAAVIESLNTSETVNKTLSQEIMESTAAFLADESENSSAFPLCGTVKPVTSLEPVTSEPVVSEDRVNAPEAVTVFPEDCSPIVAPGSPILGDRSINTRRKIRRKVSGRLSLSTSLADTSLTPTVKKGNNANTSLPVTLNVESPVPIQSEEEQRKVWEEDEDDEMLTNLEIDSVISGLRTVEEQCVSGRELRPEVSEARKRAAEEQARVVKSGIACKKGPKMAKGSLFAAKSAAQNVQRPLKMFVGLEKPGPGNRDELRRLGVGPWVCNITSENAMNFRFNAWDFYSADVCLENVFGLPVGDGSRLILNDEGTVGVAEIERAFLASESVDPALVPTGWVRNHYRWIVWKLASLERRFPKHFAHVLSPHIVMQQLKYRYDREIDRCHRPALRKILEHDDSAARRMVTCVASIKKVEGEAGIPQIELELTDGWYSVFALIDKELKNLVLKGRVASGTKLITHGAELMNCPQGCPPLEIGADVRLKITSNSCRRACWSAKLGFQRDPRPFSIPLSSVLANGGMVGCLKVYIARIYPVVYLEKNDKARTVVRSERAERREAAQAEARRLKAAEAFFVQMQAEVQHNQSNPTKTKRHVTRQLVARATTTQELCSLMESALDPAAFENMLSDEQKALVLDLQRERQESLCREVQSKVKQRLEEKTIPQRNVTPVLKVRLVDGNKPDSECSSTLSIWHPPEEMTSLFKENQLFTMYSLTVNGWRAGVLQLSATRSSQYHLGTERVELMPSPLKRTLTPLSELYTRRFSPAFGEVDAVGIVIRVDPPPQSLRNNHETPGGLGSQYQSVYLADHDQNVVGVSFWGGLKEFGVDDVIHVGVVLSMANLQWRGGSLKGPITLYAHEVSVFTLNPRQQKLRDAIQTLQKFIKPDVTSYLKSCEEKLEDLLKCATPYKMQTSSPNKDIRLQAGDSLNLGLSTPKQVPGKVSTSVADVRTSTPVQQSPLASTLKEYSPVVQERLKKLEGYGDAPPLPPIVMAQRRSSLRRGFRPPRRTLDTNSTSDDTFR